MAEVSSIVCQPAGSSRDDGPMCTFDQTQFRKYSREIDRYCSYEDLVPSLMEMGYIIKQTEWKDFLKSLISDNDDRVRQDFIRALTTPTANDHLGHIYLAGLLNREARITVYDPRIDPNRNRLIRNILSVVRLLDVGELSALMFQKRLLTRGDMEILQSIPTTSKKIIHLFQILETKGPEAYSLFLECLALDSQRPHHIELYQMVRGKRRLHAITHDTCTPVAVSEHYNSTCQEILRHMEARAVSNGIGEDKGATNSASCRRRVHQKMCSVVRLFNLRELTAIMIQKELVTFADIESLQNSPTTKNKIFEFFQILEKRGENAYKLFLECLGSDTEYHPHRELFELIVQGRETIEVMIQRHEMQGTLTGSYYRETIKLLHEYHHGGKWDKFYLLCKKCSQSKHQEICVVAAQEEAMVCIFQAKWEECKCLIRKARRICETIPGNNQKFLLGRCENILSTSYRKQGLYEKAKKHVRMANGHLSHAQFGEDIAMAKYIRALIKAQDHGKKEKIVKLYEEAIDISISPYCKDSSAAVLLQTHGPLLLAQVHLNSTLYQAGSEASPASILAAKRCLDNVDVQVLPPRYQAQYYLFKSDLLQYSSMKDDSLQFCQQALRMAKEHNFANEVQGAESRLAMNHSDQIQDS